MRRLVFFLVVFFSGAGTIPSLWAQQFSLRQFTVVDGLPQSQVNALIEDKQGYLWIGTNGGLARFDGREFKVYNTLDGLSSNFITSLMIDQQKNLWIVHPTSITRFDGVIFRKFKAPATAGPSNRIRRVFDLQDSIVVLSNQGTVGKIQGDSIYYWNRPVAANKTIFSAHRSPSRDLFFYLSDSSFLAVSPGGTRRIIPHKEHFGKLYNMVNYEKELLLDTDSGFFSLTVANGVRHRAALPIRHHLIAYDSLNNIFWTREESTFFREQVENGRTQVDTVFDEVLLTQILFDAEGNTWLGTSENGIYKYYNRDFDHCGSKKLKSVMAVEKDRSGATWIGSATRGLWKIHQGKIKTYPLADPIESSVFSIKVSPQGELWVASSSGLGRYQPAQDRFRWYHRQDGLSSQYVICLDFDDHGGLWCGTSGSGVNYFDGSKFVSYSVDRGLLSRNATAIKYVAKSQSLYVGSEFGLNVIRDKRVSEIPLPELTNTSIVSIQSYNDSLLMLGTTGAGIVFLEPTGSRHRLLTTKEGLVSNFIYFVAQDADQSLWVGTEKGISHIRLNSQLEITESIHFGDENGLAGLETNQNAFYLSDHEKYFGLIDGVYQYNDTANPPFNSYDLHLTDVELFYGEFPSREYADSSYSFFKIPYRPSFAPDKNHITFAFNRVEKRYPASIKYKYFLENFDKAWSQPTSLGKVTYGNLPPGEYVLNVIATNNQGKWDAVPLRYPFTVRTPFYKQTAFIVGVVVLGAGLIVLTLYLNVRRRMRNVLEGERIRQREQDSLRKEIARDFHDEMGNQLTRIINYISLMKLSGNGHAKELYNKVEDSAKYLYTGTRDFIWSIDPGNDELSKVFIHIRDFGEKLFEEKGIQFRAFNEVREQAHIPYGFSREVNLIIKEAMTNTFNHSRAKNVSLTLRQDDSNFEMELADDGIGFEIDDVEPNGIKNMQTRAGRMGSTLIIETIKGNGTTIRLRFPKTKTKKSWHSPVKREY